MADKQAALTARGVVERLKRLGFTHLVWLPDTESGNLWQALHDDSDIKLVPVCREGEAFAVAAGLRAGGKRPAVCIQNTGFFESGDSVRGVARDSGLPFFMMIGYRGYEPEKPMKDTAAIFLEPVLKAWEVPYELLYSDDDLDAVDRMAALAEERATPTAVLIGQEYH